LPFVAIILGMCVAIAYGGADFLGGFASRRCATGTVLFVSQCCGLVVAVVLVVSRGGGVVSPRIFLLSALAGIVGVVALGLLYRGLAVGRMNVVAPISAVGGGIIPVLWSLAQGEHPAAIALVGVVLALVAVVVVAGTVERDPAAAVIPQRELAYGIGAGIGFGMVFILFSESAAGSGLWPVLIARVVSVPILFLALFGMRESLLPRGRAFGPMIGAGLLDVSANALVLLAVRRGLVSLVAPVASLYPAATVLLARLVLQERLGARRFAGLVLALAGLVLIVAA
jgi:uncharacterized membrane protein